VQSRRPQLGAQRRHRVGKSGHHATLPGQYLQPLRVGQKAHVLGQNAVFVLRMRIGLHEALDQQAQPRRRRQRLLQHLLLHVMRQALQTFDMTGRNVQQQALLVGNVVVQRGLGDAAGRRHLIHRGCGVALARKQFGRPRQDLIALPVVAGGARAGHVSGRRTRRPRDRSAGATGR